MAPAQVLVGFHSFFIPRVHTRLKLLPIPCTFDYDALFALAGDKQRFLAQQLQLGLHRIPDSLSPEALETALVTVQRAQRSAYGQKAFGDSSALVRRFGDGLNLLRALLLPILWRNTHARLRSLGQSDLPVLHQVVMLVRLGEWCASLCVCIFVVTTLSGHAQIPIPLNFNFNSQHYSVPCVELSPLARIRSLARA